ncbi:hypothetical protein DFJ58DRAFT_913284 [Suillus subalutaceus]|uniref:uncharacterized protein n=1 Tax=Suillus subalutaceus TaxID=48586 RepID=UPI001B870A5B|nr:uncharacterized protein DFJ58DRAFT_913284 [Suillus subalutaceus]KAG1858803.1 hypothetical protein DFJ58DRAFT_913284 [Suillus subalutaceus]
MATNSKASDDSSSTASTTAPPSYYGSISANPIQYSQSFIFSFRRMKQKRAAVLSRIRDIVLAPDFTPSSLTSNVNACAAALPAAELSNILTQLNIEGHTALYWAIVNNRPEAFWALEELTSWYPSDCTYDLRIACTITSDHEMFTQLYLGGRAREDRLLTGFLSCPPDEIQVHTCDELANQFNVVLRIRMFQKRLRTTKHCYNEFVAGGRIWWLRFRMSTDGIWHARIGLCRLSPPARLNAVLLIEAHSRKFSRATPPEALKITLSLTDTKFLALAPWQ